MIKEEANEVLGGVGDNETHGLLKLVCKVHTREAIGKFSFEVCLECWKMKENIEVVWLFEGVSLTKEMDKDTSADGYSVLGLVGSPLFYNEMGLWAHCVAAHILLPWA
ncbi:unnamed protein product [Dovyalis caffra]|uniref:Uncharacterized protein n=1 Tax=Dovyalis caffra TaxID=77055 RepID=A0AAV1QTX5_9ROSI|nr:unnamed protein product [Dovyalis caffra]